MNIQDKNISKNNFEQCIKCTICTAYCPVAANNSLFPGPKQAGPDGERFRLKSAIFYDDALKFCTNCKRCEVSCPSDVKIGDIIQLARMKYTKKSPALRDMILANTDVVGTVASTFAPIVNRVVGLDMTKAVMDVALHIDKRRQFPSYSFGTFERWFKKNVRNQERFSRQISYFHGCYVNYNYPTLGRAFVKIMNALGVGVHLLRKEKCCGVALIANRLAKQAKWQAEINMKSFRESYFGKSRQVVATSSTCVFTIRDEYPHILGVDNADMREHIDLATRFIYRLFNESEVSLNYKKREKKLRIAYHTPCHLEKMGWAFYTLQLLRAIPNVELTVLNPNCCGIAGTYGFKKENYQTSQEIGAALFRQIEEGGFDFVVSDCETCKWQIEMSTTKKCLHPLEVLAESIEEDVEQ